MTEAEICPKCGSREFENHYRGTFIPDGRICLKCGHVVEGPLLEGSRVGVKGWRPAWYEEAYRKTGVLPLDFYLWFDMDRSGPG